MVLKTRPDQPVQLPTSHGSGQIRSIGPKLHWIKVKPLEPTVQPMNRTNRPVPSKLADSIKFFFFLNNIKMTPFWRVYNENNDYKMQILHSHPTAAISLPLHPLPTCRGPQHPVNSRRWSLQVGNPLSAIASS